MTSRQQLYLLMGQMVGLEIIHLEVTHEKREIKILKC